MSMTGWEPPKLRYTVTSRIDGEVQMRYIPLEPRLAVKSGCSIQPVVEIRVDCEFSLF